MWVIVEPHKGGDRSSFLTWWIGESKPSPRWLTARAFTRFMAWLEVASE